MAKCLLYRLKEPGGEEVFLQVENLLKVRVPEVKEQVYVPLPLLSASVTV